MHKTIRTVDALISDGNRVLLIRRAKPPYMDKLVLPGGHVESTDESERAACQREMREEVGLDIGRHQFRRLCRLDTPGRDPRPGRRVSTVFLVELKPEELDRAKAGDDAAAIVLHPYTKEFTRDMMGFDHFEAIVAYGDLLYQRANLEDDGWF